MNNKKTLPLTLLLCGTVCFNYKNDLVWLEIYTCAVYLLALSTIWWIGVLSIASKNFVSWPLWYWIMPFKITSFHVLGFDHADCFWKDGFHLWSDKAIRRCASHVRWLYDPHFAVSKNSKTRYDKSNTHIGVHWLVKPCTNECLWKELPTYDF